MEQIAYDIVKNGVNSALKVIPIARFGKLATVDKTEIESYRSIKNLMLEYISNKNTVRPLSIAVFGTPRFGDILKELIKITNGFTIPEDGYNTYRVTYDKLKELESETFELIHLENNILLL